MTRTLQIAVLILAGCASYACLEVGNAARQAQRTASTLNSDASTLQTSLMRSNDTLRAINEALSDPANGLQANLTDLHRTLLVAGGSVTNIEKGTRTWQTKQNQMADQAIADEEQANRSLASLTALLATLSTISAQHSSQLAILERQSSDSLAQLPPILTRIQETAANTQTITANGAKVSANAVAITADARKYADSKVAPVRKIVSVAHGIESGIGRVLGGLL